MLFEADPDFASSKRSVLIRRWDVGVQGGSFEVRLPDRRAVVVLCDLFEDFSVLIFVNCSYVH